MSSPLILRVAVPVPLYRTFDYLPPEGADAALLRRGCRLRIPFGRSILVGLLLDRVDRSDVPGSQLKRVSALVDREPLLSQADLALLQWAAEYYCHPIGEVLFAALPSHLRGGARTGTPCKIGWRVSAQGACFDADALARAPRQALILRTLQARPAGLSQAELKHLCGPRVEALRGLAAKRLAEPFDLAERALLPPGGYAEAPQLNKEQAAAVEAVGASLGGFEAFLLDGVTGSGKTEVYLGLVERVIAEGLQVLVVVPEIALTPQLMERFQRRIRAPLALLHSGLGDRERAASWDRARTGSVSVVIGTRSAVFTPLPRLGLIVVDEEHDLSLKQQDGFRYSARDVAVMRASRSGCPVVLGSATPSLESLYNAEEGRYRRLVLPSRAGGAALPKIEVVDIRSAPLDSGLPRPLLKAVGRELSGGNQVMLFLNRRGYAPVLICHDCGWVAGCNSCDSTMTVHRARGELRCHHCGACRPMAAVCPECAGSDLRMVGHGTEQIEQALQRRFPDSGLARVDRDTTRRRGRLEALLSEARSGRASILLGTQMLAKGHDFPDVTLVGIVDMDQGLFGADYRSAERMAQLLLQVAGRAGRAGKAGRVLVQTRHPQHPLLLTLIRHGYGAFSREALQERREAQLPPFCFQALLRAESTHAEEPERFLIAARNIRPTDRHLGVEIWGPVPAPMERRGGRYRAQLLVQAPGRPPLHALLREWVPAICALPEARRVRWSLDVDPQEML